MNLLKIEISEIESLPNGKIQKMLKEIYSEVDRIRQGKYRVSFADIINYIYGRGDWDFDIQDENGLRRGEVLIIASGEELSKAIELCSQKLWFTNALEYLIGKLKHKKITCGEGLLSFLIQNVEEGLNEVWAADIIHYILYKGLNEKDKIYTDIIKWCYERISKDDALIFDPGFVRNADTSGKNNE